MGAEYSVAGLVCVPRQGVANGRIADYAFYLSGNGKSWGEPVASGRFPDGADTRTVMLAAPVEARFLRVVALSEVNGNPWTSIAEIGIKAAGREH